jgi:hypothetical protein
VKLDYARELTFGVSHCGTADLVPYPSGAARSQDALPGRQPDL